MTTDILSRPTLGGATTVTQRDFMSTLRLLHNIDAHEVSFLTPAQWERFRDDPPAFMIRADDDTLNKLWTVVQARTRK